MEVCARTFFTKEQKELIVCAVKHAELNTSGEVRVHIENSCPGDSVERAASVFEKLGMTKTALRNGVLFYLAIRDRKFAIIGDHGIDEKVPADFWEGLKLKMLVHFREARFAEGLSLGIELTGLELKKHFPYQRDDVNELPDDISFGK